MPHNPHVDNPLCECADCGEQFHEHDLNDIKDYHQRVAPGEEAPAGECPECGALCHVIEQENTAPRLTITPPVCNECGSHNIAGIPTSCYWDVAAGRWQFSDDATIEDLSCIDCGSDNCNNAQATKRG